MRKAGRIFRWILFSIFVQVLLLSYLNFIYLPMQTSVALSAFEEFELDGGRKFKIPTDAAEIKVSFDGAYAGYFAEGKLILVETKNGRKLQPIHCGEPSRSFFRWLPDRNMAIYSMGTEDRNDIKIATYDMESQVERQYPAITGIPKGSVVMDIHLSTLTNVVYVKIKSDVTKAKVYKYNIMDDLETVMNIHPDKNILEMSYRDTIVYENERNTLAVKDDQKDYTLPFSGKMVLLGVDSEDTVYAGEVDEDGWISTVYSGGLEAMKAKKWHRTDIGKRVPAKDIVVNTEGEIYVIDRDLHVLKGIGKDREIIFPGDFVELHEKFVVAREGDWIRINII